MDNLRWTLQSSLKRDCLSLYLKGVYVGVNTSVGLCSVSVYFMSTVVFFPAIPHQLSSVCINLSQSPDALPACTPVPHYSISYTAYKQYTCPVKAWSHQKVARQSLSMRPEDTKYADYLLGYLVNWIRCPIISWTLMTPNNENNFNNPVWPQHCSSTKNL